jgi:hypothetical protein
MQIADWNVPIISPLIFIKKEKIPNKVIDNNETQPFNALTYTFPSCILRNKQWRSNHTWNLPNIQQPLSRYHILSSNSKKFDPTYIHIHLYRPINIYCHVLEWPLVIGFIDNLYTQLVTTSKYNSLTGLHTLKIAVTEAHTGKKSSMPCPVVSW